MYFRNEAHKTAFSKASRKLNRRDRSLMCKLYLLTADRALWRAASRQVSDGKIPLGKIRLYCGTENSYTLLCCAKDLTLGTDHITVADLADREVISAKMYKVIETAMAIRRYGIIEIQEENTDGEKRLCKSN